jgi:hypothetical protein
MPFVRAFPMRKCSIVSVLAVILGPAIIDTRNPLGYEKGCFEGMVISRVLAVAKPRGGPELWMIGNYLGRRLLVRWTLIQSRAVLSPVENCFTARVHAGIAVADAGKEFDEAAAGALALGADNYRQRFESGTDQRRRRYDLVGQQDRRL